MNALNVFYMLVSGIEENEYGWDLPWPEKDEDNDDDELMIPGDNSDSFFFLESSFPLFYFFIDSEVYELVMIERSFSTTMLKL